LQVISSIEEMRAFSSEERARGRTIALVPTMGALHRGHLALLSEARGLADTIVLTIFVNPTQFSQGEDLDSYPRDLAADLLKARSAGVSAVFTPEAGDMYPPGFQTEVRVRELEKHLCGPSRPGHFVGVATVVLKLFNITQPHVAVFGEKDYQQLLIIRRMVCDLDLGVDVRGVPTVREPDGLAMSSRNRYLSVEERQAAASIPRALEEARKVVEGGQRDAGVVAGTVKKVLSAEPLVDVEYVVVADADTLEGLSTVRGDGSALVQVAVRIGRARLIDHVLL
jgi:pantoate--beta-alanine ligase